MSELTQFIITAFIIVTWFAGIVIAKGFWMTFFALLPPVAWYLLIQRIMQVWGLV